MCAPLNSHNKIVLDSARPLRDKPVRERLSFESVNHHVMSIVDMFEPGFL